MTETIAAEELARLGALLEKATRGPWNHLGYCGQDGVIQGARQIPVASAIAGKTSGHTGHQAFDDAALIVALVNALPALLARIAELEEALGLTSGYLEEAANVVEGNGLPQLAGLLRNQHARARATLERAQAEGEGK